MLPLLDMGLGLPKPCAAPGLCSPWCGATPVLQFPVTAPLCPSLRPPLPPPGRIFHRQGRTCSCCEDKIVPCRTDKGASHPLSPPPPPPRPPVTAAWEVPGYQLRGLSDVVTEQPRPPNGAGVGAKAAQPGL